MEDEKVLASWNLDSSRVVFGASIVTFVIFFLFAFSFVTIFIISKSTNILLLVVPILFFFVLLAAVPEFFKSLKGAPSSAQVFLTDKGVYKGQGQNRENYKFIPWEQMNGYDMSYLASSSPLGKFYTRPTKFFLKSKYEEDNIVVEAFGEDVDVLRAYLKEYNVPFGFLKKS